MGFQPATLPIQLLFIRRTYLTFHTLHSTFHIPHSTFHVPHYKSLSACERSVSICRANGAICGSPSPRMASVSICAICGRINHPACSLAHCALICRPQIPPICTDELDNAESFFEHETRRSPTDRMGGNLTNLTNADMRNAFGVWNLTNAYPIKHRRCFSQTSFDGFVRFVFFKISTRMASAVRSVGEYLRAAWPLNISHPTSTIPLSPLSRGLSP